MSRGSLPGGRLLYARWGDKGESRERLRSEVRKSIISRRPRCSLRISRGSQIPCQSLFSPLLVQVSLAVRQAWGRGECTLSKTPQLSHYRPPPGTRSTRGSRPRMCPPHCNHQGNPCTCRGDLSVRALVLLAGALGGRQRATQVPRQPGLLDKVPGVAGSSLLPRTVLKVVPGPH